MEKVIRKIDPKMCGVADLSFPTSKLRRGRVQGNGWICPTLTTSSTGIYRIEKQESTEQQ